MRPTPIPRPRIDKTNNEEQDKMSSISTPSISAGTKVKKVLESEVIPSEVPKTPMPTTPLTIDPVILNRRRSEMMARLPKDVDIPATTGASPLQLIEDEEYYLRKLREVQEAKIRVVSLRRQHNLMGYGPEITEYIGPIYEEKQRRFEQQDVKIDVDRYMQYMYRKKKMMRQMVLDRKKIEAETQYIREIRRHPDFKPFRMGDLVFLDHSGGSLLHAPSKKFQRNWIGPLKIHQVLDETHYIVSDWDDKVLSPKVHINRLKKYVMNMGKINEEGKLEVIDNAKELYDKWLEILKDKEYSK